ncbi:MAG: HTH domain-containing protein, partial [Chloroflexota bacterium]
MKPGEGLGRSIRLARMQHFLHKNARGLTSQELAKLCEVCVRTVQRDLLALQSDLEVPVTQDGDRYGILNSYILPLSFTGSMP